MRFGLMQAENSADAGASDVGTKKKKEAPVGVEPTMADLQSANTSPQRRGKHRLRPGGDY